jgi:hypothetical protein
MELAVNTESAELETEGEEGGNIESRVYLQVHIAWQIVTIFLGKDYA